MFRALKKQAYYLEKNLIHESIQVAILGKPRTDLAWMLSYIFSDLVFVMSFGHLVCTITMTLLETLNP
jgi:hypothetical protein